MMMRWQVISYLRVLSSNCDISIPNLAELALVLFARRRSSRYRGREAARCLKEPTTWAVMSVSDMHNSTLDQ